MSGRCSLPVASILFLSGILSAAPGFRSVETPGPEVLARLLKIPARPPDVSASVREVRQEGGLIVEDVTWLADDGQYPPVFVIRPAGSIRERLPAVICLHGSSGSRESMVTEAFGVGPWTRFGASSSHQRLLGWARELSRRGYLSLSLTQRGLDSRTPNTETQTKDLLVRGRTLMGALVQENRQAISYLLSRPDVDPRRIAIAGLSFGGITSFYTWAVDERAHAMVSICGGVGSVDLLLRQGSPGYHGIYWYVPDLLTVGDQGAFAAAAAPRPLMVWGPLDDIGMPREGVAQFVDLAKPAYARAGAEGNLVVHTPPGEHTFSLEAFEAMVEFLDRHLAVD